MFNQLSLVFHNIISYIILIINILHIMNSTNKLKTIFGQIPDFRRTHKQLYDLESILLIGIISVICGQIKCEFYAKSQFS